MTQRTTAPFVFTLFTKDPQLASRADAAGVERIGVDLERLGKADRQQGLNTWISDHTREHLIALRHSVRHGSLFVRTNPVHPGLSAEIDDCLRLGARVLMLPMFTTRREAAAFVDMVRGRATVVLLVETPAAAARLHDIVTIPGVDEIHVGLNDMRLAMGLRSHFSLLASDLMDSLAGTVLDAGIPLGIGGVGRTSDDGLPIHPDLVYAQLCRLGATRALISRSFFPSDPLAMDFPVELTSVRRRLDEWRGRPAEEQLSARSKLRRECVD